MTTPSPMPTGDWRVSEQDDAGRATEYERLVRIDGEPVRLSVARCGDDWFWTIDAYASTPEHKARCNHKTPESAQAAADAWVAGRGGGK